MDTLSGEKKSSASNPKNAALADLRNMGIAAHIDAGRLQLLNVYCSIPVLFTRLGKYMTVLL